MPKHTSWLWPDRTIGKRESRTLREEHNATVNSHADLLACLRKCVDEMDSRGDYERQRDGGYDDEDAAIDAARTAIAGAI